MILSCCEISPVTSSFCNLWSFKLNRIPSTLKTSGWFATIWALDVHRDTISCSTKQHSASCLSLTSLLSPCRRPSLSPAVPAADKATKPPTQILLPSSCEEEKETFLVNFALTAWNWPLAYLKEPLFLQHETISSLCLSWHLQPISYTAAIRPLWA